MPPFHPGELAVQERAGVEARAERVGGSIHREIGPPAEAFLAERRWVVLAAADHAGRPWATVLAGAPGFARATGPRTVRLAADPAPGDPLSGHLTEGRVAGLLAIDPPTRRRMRLNGTLGRDEAALLLHAEQVYANCPKYIHPRDGGPGSVAGGAPRRGGGLSDAQRGWIRRADTFFIATLNPGEGADASHRGGPPGFVAVEGNRLVWPDYAGNMMYNTLGNIALHGRAGLLFLDLERGARLMLTGTARIDWDPARAREVPGAQRLVELEVEEVVEMESGSAA
jgi:hypothetical protein